MSNIPTKRERIVFAVVAAVLFASVSWFVSKGIEGYASDWDQVWHGAKASLEGKDPYSVVGPGLAADYGFPLYYPYPSLVAMLPLALLPLGIGRTVFVGISAGFLAYAVTRDGRHGIWVLASGSFVGALVTAQWSPLMTAAFLLPWLAPVILAKPNIGLAVAAAIPDGRFYGFGLAGSAILLLISFTLEPQWIGKWLDALQEAPHFTPPVLLWGGPLILLALSRWRRPEARLLVALACVPHTTLVYETLPLLLVAKTRRQAMLLSVLSFLVFLLQYVIFDVRVPITEPQALATFAEWARSVGTASVALLYLPALIMVLRRPNEGEPPAWWPLLSHPLKVIRGC